jgi:hypothetical protein
MEIPPYRLTESKRLEARALARANLLARLGGEPTREQFKDYAQNEYPAFLRYMAIIGLALIALTTGWISAVRLYQAGYDHAAEFPRLVRISIGASTPLGAEALIIIATITAAIYLSGTKRLISLIPILAGAILAFVGNWAISNPNTTFGWVEALFPPIAVLSVGFLAEIIILPEMARQGKNENAFQLARVEWKHLSDHIEEHPDWMRTYATALWDTWRKGRKAEWLDEITEVQRNEIVWREIQSDEWFQMKSHEIAGKSQGVSPVIERPNRAAIMEWLKADPARIALPQIEIAEITGATKSTVNRAVIDYKSEVQ